jgi:hypothetical protein
VDVQAMPHPASSTVDVTQAVRLALPLTAVQAARIKIARPPTAVPDGWIPAPRAIPPRSTPGAAPRHATTAVAAHRA